MQYTEYRTRQDDVLDEVCFQHYGTETGTTEMVLAANPGLCEYPPHLPMGLLIKLPVIDTSPAPVVESIQLWS